MRGIGLLIDAAVIINAAWSRIAGRRAHFLGGFVGF
jgi:hypothetical protein